MWSIKMKTMHKFMTVFIFVFLFSLSLASAVTWRHNGTDMMKLDDEGNLTVLGNVTADYFIGDGSLLTNVPAGSLGNSINTTEIEDGTITADDLAADSINGTHNIDNVGLRNTKVTGNLNVTQNVTIGSMVVYEEGGEIIFEY